jgi:hypothetical protein
MKQQEEIHRWLAAYFQAVGIILQIPGELEIIGLARTQTQAQGPPWETEDMR